MKQNYFLIFILLLFSIILSIVIYAFSFLFIKQENDVDKLSAYECGFNPYDDARKIFDVRFYLIAILFIVFDIEAIYIIPWAITLSSNFSFAYWTMIEFIFELIIGFIYVWHISALEWE